MEFVDPVNIFTLKLFMTLNHNTFHRNHSSGLNNASSDQWPI